MSFSAKADTLALWLGYCLQVTYLPCVIPSDRSKEAYHVCSCEEPCLLFFHSFHFASQCMQALQTQSPPGDLCATLICLQCSNPVKRLRQSITLSRVISWFKYYEPNANMLTKPVWVTIIKHSKWFSTTEKKLGPNLFFKFYFLYRPSFSYKSFKN